MNQTNANHHLLLLRAVAIWRKDLCHYNKTRDNHFKLYGKYFDFTLIVRANASIGSHVKSEGTKVIKINTLFNGVLGYFEFYLRSLLLLLKLHISKSFNFIIAPIGEEPVGWFIRIIAFPRLKIAYDLWDVPGKSITKKNYSSKEVFRRIYHYVLRKIIKRCDVAIVGVIPEGLESFGIGPSKIIQSENGVNLDTIYAMASEQKEYVSFPNDHDLKLIYVGYLHSARGGADMLNALASIRSKGVRVQLLMIGPSDDSGLNELHSLCKKLEIEDFVNIHDAVSSESIPYIINHADIGLCPLQDIHKFRYSYPVKVYEYLALGKPVVATRLPGTEHLIKDGENGMLYQSGNVDALTDVLMRFVENPELISQMAIKSKESVIGKDWESVVANIAEELNRRLGNAQ